MFALIEELGFGYISAIIAAAAVAIMVAFSNFAAAASSTDTQNVSINNATLMFMRENRAAQATFIPPTDA